MDYQEYAKQVCNYLLTTASKAVGKIERFKWIAVSNDSGYVSIDDMVFSVHLPNGATMVFDCYRPSTIRIQRGMVSIYSPPPEKVQKAVKIFDAVMGERKQKLQKGQSLLEFALLLALLAGAIILVAGVIGSINLPIANHAVNGVISGLHGTPIP